MYWVGMRLLIRRLIQFVSGAALASSSTCTSGGVIDSVADTNKPDSKLHRKQSCVSRLTWHHIHTLQLVCQWTNILVSFHTACETPRYFFPSSCGCHLHHTPTFSSIKAMSATVLCDVAPTVCQEN